MKEEFSKMQELRVAVYGECQQPVEETAEERQEREERETDEMIERLQAMGSQSINN